MGWIKSLFFYHGDTEGTEFHGGRIGKIKISVSLRVIRVSVVMFQLEFLTFLILKLVAK
jgi:hypothetical protein